MENGNYANKENNMKKLREEIDELQKRNWDLEGSIVIVKKKTDDLYVHTKEAEHRSVQINERIHELKDCIKQVKQERMMSLATFETEVNRLVEKMATAPFYFEKENLAQLWKDICLGGEKFETKVTSIEEEILDMQETMDKLQIDNVSMDYHDIPISQRRNIWDLLQKERLNLLNLLDVMAIKRSQLDAQVKLLE